MSALKENQIKSFLKKHFFDSIDVSDLKSPTDDNRYTRALAAFALAIKANLSFEDAAQKVVDGSGDCGIDAFHYDRTGSMFHIVQAKWSIAGNKTIGVADIHKVFDGLRNCLEGDSSGFNSRIKSRWAEIEEAAEHAERVSVSIIYNSENELNAEVQRTIDKSLTRLTAGDDTINVTIIRRDNLWKKIKEYQRGPDISAEIKMFYWGNVDEPVQAYYGQVAASDLAELYRIYGQRLFVQNVREFLGNSEVNDGIAFTVKSRPEAFWYFHNGITILAKKIRRKLIGGNERTSGNFEVDGIEIVNGAQTVGTLGSMVGVEEKLAATRVPVRMISLENAPQEFSKSITIANNTQNRISAKDFISLDVNQERLFFELKAIDVEYLFKSSVRTSQSGAAISLEDAAISLACAYPDVELAVIAKSAIGRLWDTSSSGWYSKIFNSSVSGQQLWRLVQVLKQSDLAIREWRTGKEGRTSQFANYCNRIIQHCLYNIISRDSTLQSLDQHLMGEHINKTTKNVADSLFDIAESKFQGCYYASLSKNTNRCRQLAQFYMYPSMTFETPRRRSKRKE